MTLFNISVPWIRIAPPASDGFPLLSVGAGESTQEVSVFCVMLGSTADTSDVSPWRLLERFFLREVVSDSEIDSRPVFLVVPASSLTV